MPLKLRRFFTSISIICFAAIAAVSAQAPPANQTTQAAPTTPPQTPLVVEKQPSSAEVMRERISKAKAYIAVRNYNAAIYELESIRKETSDQSVNAVANVLLMNSYLEQGDHKRAQGFLNEFFKSYKSNSALGNMYYAAIAAQVIKGARNQVERYKALGLNPSDRNLPLEAVNDIERMRETLELVISQAKELGADKNKASTAMALLEEATNSRSMIARDDYDARRWRDELTDSREQIANSRSVIINAVDGTTVASSVPQDTTVATVAMNVPPSNTNSPAATPVPKPVPTQPQSVPSSNTNLPAAAPTQQQTPPANTIAVNKEPQVTKPAETTTAKTNETTTAKHSELRPNVRDNQPQTNDASKTSELRPNVRESEPASQKQPATEAPKQSAPAPTPATTASSASASGPMEVGSLIAYATKQQAPVYPPAARNMRASGVVKVEVTIDEAGDVAEVHNMSGPSLLQTAAKDAIRKWKFKPFVRDGQPVKATGFVNFNFSL